jgi:hypothetical protein
MKIEPDWYIYCMMPINEGEQFFNAFAKSGIFGFRFGPLEAVNSNDKGRPSIRSFQKFCRTSKFFSLSVAYRLSSLNR